MNPTELVMLTDTTKQKPSRKYHHEIHVFATNIANFHICLGREQGLFIAFTFLSLKGLEEEMSSPVVFVLWLRFLVSGLDVVISLKLVIHVVQSLWMSMYNVPHKINFKVVL